MKGDRNAPRITDALMMAVWRREKADARLHRSDRGSTYKSEQGPRLLADNQITCLMSGAGNVWDRLIGTPLAREIMTRSAQDGFISTPKSERTVRTVYRTGNEARADVLDDFDRFDNPRRRHSKPDHRSAMEIETRTPPA